VWFLRDLRNPPNADPERTRLDASARRLAVAGGVTGALPGASSAGALPVPLGRRGIRTARGDSRPLRICRVDQKPRGIPGTYFAATSERALGRRPSAGCGRGTWLRSGAPGVGRQFRSRPVDQVSAARRGVDAYRGAAGVRSRTGRSTWRNGPSSPRSAKATRLLE
jgi:hypothetical protein